jgi:hypothetical protein
MADVKALENGFGTLFDRGSPGNMGCFMFSGVPTVFALAMGTHQEQNEMSDFLVNPLIDGFMANGLLRVIDGEPPGDKFRRPSEAKVFFDIVPNRVVFEPLPPMGFVLAFIRSLLSFVSQVISGINRRGISLKLP